MLDLFVMGEGAHRRAAGAALFRPTGLRQDRAIGQHRQPRPVAQGKERRGARLGDIGAGSHHAHARGAQVLARLDQRVVPPVEAVVTRHRDVVESCDAQRGRALGPRHYRMARLRHARSARCEAGLELPERQVGGTQDIRRGGKALVIVIAVERDVAGGQQDLGSAHARASRRGTSVIGRSTRIEGELGWTGSVMTCPACCEERDRPRR